MSTKSEEHILAIRLSAMGDVAMMVPVLIALTQQHPEVKVTVVSRGFFKPIFKDLPNVFFHEVDTKETHKGILGIYRLYRELVRLEVSAVADLHNVLRSNILNILFLSREIPTQQINKGRSEKRALTRSKNKQFLQLRTTHERYADVFRKLHFPIVLKKEHTLPKRKLTDSIYNVVGKDVSKWIGIAPFAAFQGKTYPLKLMEQAIKEMALGKQVKTLLFGSKAEMSKLIEIEKKYPHVVCVAGKLNFEEELILISNLDLMVSMDSGNAHLAAMFGIKTITLWGVTHPYAGFYPYCQSQELALLANREQYPLIPTSVYGNKAPEGYEKSIETIKPETLAQKVLKELNLG